MKNIFAFALIVFCQTDSVAGPLTQVPRTAFLNAKYESFEEPIDWTNAQEGSGYGVCPGKYRDYVFSQSGIALTYPIPNNVGGTNPSITVYSANEDAYNLNGYGPLTTDTVPDGDHYLLAVGPGPNPYQLTFPYNTVTKVGGYWIMAGKTPGQDRIEVDAYDLQNNWLGSALIPAVNAVEWKNNFYGFEAPDGSYIKKITIVAWPYTPSASHAGVDMLMFDYDLPTVKTWLYNSGSVASWNMASNWDFGKPENPGDTAIFGSSASSAMRITLDNQQKAGTLVFNNSGARYTISPGSPAGQLALDSSSNAQINVHSGSHSITAPLLLQDNLEINLAPNTELAIQGPISGQGKSLVKQGNGLLVLSGNNSYTGGTTVNSGILWFDGANSLPAGHSLAVGAGATVSLGSGLSAGSGHSSSPSAAVPEPCALWLLTSGAISAGAVVFCRKLFHRKVM